MIELTDEQIRELKKGSPIKDLMGFFFNRDDLKRLLNNAVNSLTLSQIKQRAEQYNADVIEWVDFDPKDKSTWPGYGKYLIDSSEGIIQGIFHSWGDTFQSSISGNDIGMDGFKVTRWACLPKTKEK